MTSNLDRKIQVSQCDIDFWTQQLAQHALFLQDLFNPQNAGDLIEEAKMLCIGWSNQLKKNPIEYNPILSNSQYSLLHAAKSRLSRGVPINNKISGDDLHDLLHHMILEQTFFVRLAQGRMTIGEELQFWVQENREHTDFVSRFLPDGILKDEISDLVDKLEDHYELPENLKLIRASNKAMMEVHNAVHSKQITAIDDAMLEHEIREAKKGEQRVSFLLSLLQQK